ncbi:NAD(P)-binding protein [Durotheca rogersii]|uniref:NAD(P)-binding protein n=1 Tax=Durotheca rogersii TaxID=419775 RepID=UPI00221F08AD|nr:NAD(P)-binding protein [Durotheca rogersii]KAI5856188.1 NAD(P)-binding protein [Durotheca rogersii]
MATTSHLPSKILIFGATGAIGKYITDAILSAEALATQQISIFTSAVTVSNPGKQALLSSWESQGLSVITGNLNDAGDIEKAYDGIDTVISCLGRDVLASQIELLTLAEKSKDVQWFFLSEYGTDIEYDESSKTEKPHQNKLRVREFIRANIHRVECTYLVTGPYIDMFLTLLPGSEEAGGFDVESKRAVVIESGDDKVGFTTMLDVGKLVVAALRHPSASKGKILKVQSFVTTPNAILREFEKQTGVKWKVDHTTNQRLRELELENWDTDSPTATRITLRRIWAEGGTLYEKTDNEILGVVSSDMESLAAVVKRAVEGRGYQGKQPSLYYKQETGTQGT